MHIEFCVKGLPLTATVYYRPTIPAKTWGPIENCHPAEDGEIEIETMECDGKDALFLLESTFVDEITEAAMEAADTQAKAEKAEAIIDAYCF